MSQFDIIVLSRNTELVPSHINKIVKVHDGKKFYEFLITKKMLGFKIGCFLSTRSDFIYKKIK
jgi:ribosomal protein S19